VVLGGGGGFRGFFRPWIYVFTTVGHHGFLKPCLFLSHFIFDVVGKEIGRIIRTKECDTSKRRPSFHIGRFSSSFTFYCWLHLTCFEIPY